MTFAAGLSVPPAFFTDTRDEPEAFLAACLPAVRAMAKGTKTPAIWGGDGVTYACTGAAALAETIEGLLAAPPGPGRWYGLAAGSLMVYATCSGLWRDQRAYEAFSDAVAADLTGEILRRPPGLAKSKMTRIVRTALPPLLLAVKYVLSD